MTKPPGILGVLNGAKESRTPDLFVANEALYQLSYRPFKHALHTAVAAQSEPES